MKLLDKVFMNSSVHAIILLLCVFSLCVADELVIDKQLTVIRGDYKEVHFLAADNAKDLYAEGFFTCQGGLNDDISLLVLTKDQYVRWYSNYPNKPILKHEKKKEGKFRFPIEAGETYYFVFDNFFSTVSNKSVKIQVKLTSANSK